MILFHDLDNCDLLVPFIEPLTFMTTARHGSFYGQIWCGKSLVGEHRVHTFHDGQDWCARRVRDIKAVILKAAQKNRAIVVIDANDPWEGNDE